MPDSSQLIKEPAVFTLEDDERAQVTTLVERLVTAFPAAGGIECLRAATLQSRQLPERLLEFLLGIRSREAAAAFVVSGFAVDDDSIGPTPPGWAGSPTLVQPAPRRPG